MAQVKPETIKSIASEFFDYPISEESAVAVAKAANAIQADARRLSTLGLEDLEPPFSYETLVAEAERIRRGD